jgi:hypothetical protein
MGEGEERRQFRGHSKEPGGVLLNSQSSNNSARLKMRNSGGGGGRRSEEMIKSWKVRGWQERRTRIMKFERLSGKEKENNERWEAGRKREKKNKEGERLTGKEEENYERLYIGCQERRRKIMKGERLTRKRKGIMKGERLTGKGKENNKRYEAVRKGEGRIRKDERLSKENQESWETGRKVGRELWEIGWKRRIMKGERLAKKMKKVFYYQSLVNKRLIDWPHTVCLKIL